MFCQEDHETTLNRLVDAYSKRAKAWRDAAELSADSPGSALVRREQIQATETALLGEEEYTLGMLDRVTPILDRAVELLVTREVHITEGEMEKATARMALVAEDCDRLALPALRDAIRAALRKDDRPAMFLYQRYAPSRLDKAAPVTVEPGTFLWPDAARDEIRSLLRQVTTKLTKETRHTGHKDAVAAQKKAQDLRARVRRDQMDRDQRLARARGELVAYPT